jgi:hypothetical protein
MLTAAVSGSFHRHMDAITSAVHELAALSVRVLSPADPRVVAQQGDFLFVASDVVRSVRLVQDRHLECIRASSLLWLVCPDGYVGQSAAMELGYAAAVGVPIIAARAPADLTLRQYVKIVPSLGAALEVVRALPRTQSSEGLLIDPHASLERAHAILEQIRGTLTRSGSTVVQERGVYRHLADLKTRLALPAYIQ